MSAMLSLIAVDPAGLRGRVRRADPITVTSLDSEQARTVPGGWCAEVVDPAGRVVGGDVRADWRGAMATCEFLLRMYGVIA
jgi:hypothetical protein